MTERLPHNSESKPTNIIDKIDYALDTRFPGYDDRLAARAKKFGKNVLPAAAGAVLFTVIGLGINEVTPPTPIQTGTIEYTLPGGDPGYQQNSIRNDLVRETIDLAHRADVPVTDIKGASRQAKDVYNEGDIPPHGGIVVQLSKKALFGYVITADRYDLNSLADVAPLEQSDK